MELRHLRYFVAVAEELHFGRAAERLCIAQPPLSQQIQQLEREIGFALFTRTKRRVQLTAAGSMFLDEAREVFRGLDKAVHLGRRITRGEVGWLGIGFVGSATYELLPRILSAFREQFPEVELVLRELVSGKQIQAIRDGRIHVCLARPPIEEEDIHSEVVSSEQLVAAIPSSHRLAGAGSISLSSLAAEPFILFPREPKPSYADFVFSVCAEAGFVPNVVQETAEIHTAIGLVAAGVGVSLVPESMQRFHREGIRYLELEEAPISNIEIAFRQGDPNPTVQAFIRIARQMTRQPDGK
jgi:DNA-binding transcriptional LysR family regulator